MMNQRLILIQFLLTGIFYSLTAQKTTELQQDFPVHISILDESASLPNFWFLRYAYNPAVIVGTEYALKKEAKYDWHLTANLGFFHRKEWQTAIFLLPEIGYRRQLNRWRIYSRLGLGYTHSFVARPIYKFEDTQFQKMSNPGSPFLTTSLSMNVGYQLKDEEKSPVLYFSFMTAALLPFDEWTGLHQFVGVGYQFFPFKNK